MSVADPDSEAARRGRLGVMRHGEDDFEIYRYFPAARQRTGAPWRTPVSSLNLEEVEWLHERMPEMGHGEILELLPAPAAVEL